MAKVNPFNDVADIDPSSGPQNVYGTDLVDNIQAIKIGSGATAFKADQSGIWLGANEFADAPFSVSMDGKIITRATDGTGSITINSTDKTIIINDGTNDRVLLGFQSGGF